MTCTPGVLSLALNGTAVENGISITRTAVAADDVMQAFLWRHLVTADEWLVNVVPGRGKRPPIELANPLPLRIPVGGKAEVRVKAGKWIVDRGVELEPNEAPNGITLSPARQIPNGFAFDVMADATAAPGLETNLIIHLFSKAQPRKKGAKARAKYRISNLPAIPIILLKPNAP